MFRSLANALSSANLGAAALFDLHPDLLLVAAELAWEAERARRGLPWPGLASPGDRLKGYGPVRTANGALLDDEATAAAVKAALASFAGPPSLGWAWLVEGSGLVAMLGDLVRAELSGGSARLSSEGSRRWLRTCEQLLGGDNLLTLRGALRDHPSETRARTYRRVFGAPVAADGVLFDGVEGSFTSQMAAWLSGGAVGDPGNLGQVPVALAREAFAASELVSWLYLSLFLPDSPVAADLGLSDQDVAGRMAGLAEALGLSLRSKAGALLRAADLIEAAQRGEPDAHKALAAIWGSLEGQPDEDPERGAGGDVGLAFGGAMHFTGEGPLNFMGDLEPSALRVTDHDARVRTPPPALAITRQLIAFNETVRAADVCLQKGDYFINVPLPTDPNPRWTRLSNLSVPPNALVGQIKPSDPSHTGPFAMWSKGSFIGLTPLWLVGATAANGLILVAEETLSAYMDMLEAANQDGLDLAINSGFRSYPEQKALYDLYLAHKGNLAARPGCSNHQSGLAIDLAVGMGKGNPSSDVKTWTRVYTWLVRNARTYGFLRTVESEAWHWEHRPDLAADDDTFGNWTALKKADEG